MESFKIQDKYITLTLISEFPSIDFVKSLLKDLLFNTAYLNPDLILDVFQVSVALMAALNNLKNNKLITKNLPSEVILALSASKNISRSWKLFSTEEGDRVVLVTIGDSDSREAVLEILTNNSIKILPLSDLKSNDVEPIKKVYKINEKELESSSILNSIVSRIAANLM